MIRFSKSRVPSNLHGDVGPFGKFFWVIEKETSDWWVSEIKYETRTVGRRRCRSLPNGLPGRVREPVNIIKVSVNKRFCMSRPFFFSPVAEWWDRTLCFSDAASPGHCEGRQNGKKKENKPTAPKTVDKKWTGPKRKMLMHGHFISVSLWSSGTATP